MKLVWVLFMFMMLPAIKYWRLFSGEELNDDELILGGEVESSDDESECNEKYCFHMTFVSTL